MARSKETPAPEEVETTSYSESGIPTVKLYDDPNGTTFEVPVNHRDGKVFISGRLHEAFSNRILQRNEEIEKDTGNLKHVVEVLALTDEKERAEYMARHASEVVQDIIALGSRVNSNGSKTPGMVAIEKRFTYDAMKILSSTRDLTPEQKALFDLPIDSDFWQDQNLDALQEQVDWFRRRLGL
jgi:hypothetical protein